MWTPAGTIHTLNCFPLYSVCVRWCAQHRKHIILQYDVMRLSYDSDEGTEH